MPSVITHEAPVLRRGRHASPRNGACLVELIATLPGGVWTDNPGHVDAYLTGLARLVNDSTSDSRRNALLGLLPWLSVPPVDDELAWQLSIMTLLDEGLRSGTAGGSDPHGRRRDAMEHLQAEIAFVRAGRLRPDGFRMRRRVRRTIRLAIRMIAQRRADDGLYRVLHGAVDAARVLHGRGPSAPLDHPAGLSWPDRLAIEAEIRVPGGDSTYLHCRAALHAWPAWLVAAGDFSPGRSGHHEP